jgi:hypothetical protein
MLLARVMARYFAPRYVLMGSVLVAFSPFAIFLYNGYSESAYFFASALLLYALTDRPRVGLAVAAVLIASVARPWGIVAALVMATSLVLRWWEHPQERSLAPNRIVFALCVASLGFVGITWYFDRAFGDPLIFLNGAAVWSSPTTSLKWGALTAEGLGFALGKFRESPFHSMAIGATLYLSGILACMLARRWFPREITLYVAIHAIAFYFLTYWSTHGVLNSGRYSLLLFPVAFFALVVFQRIDRVVAPDSGTTAAAALPAPRPAFIGTPLPSLAYATAVAFFALYLRYASDFVNSRWVS